MKHSVEEIVLENGMRGLLIDIPDATVMSFRFNLRAGDYFSPTEQYEAAHIMEHMVLGANEKYRSSRKFSAELEKNGAYSNASTGFVSMNYIAECADFEWDRVLELIILAISKPYFNNDEFEAEFGNVKEELTGGLNNHHQVLFSEIHKAFDASKLFRTDSERLELLPNVDITAIKAHYKKTHHSDNIRFVIAGKMQGRKNKITNVLEAAGLARGERFAFPTSSVQHLDKSLYIERKEVKNIIFDIRSYKMRRFSDKENDAMAMADTMLTSSFNSLIFGEAREKGLVYGIWSAFDRGMNESSWDFSAQVNQDNIEPLFDIIKKHVKNLQKGEIDKEVIESARQYRLGSFQMGAQTVGSLVKGYGGRYFFDGTIIDYTDIPNRIKAVNKTQIVDAVKTMLEDNMWGIGILGNCGEEYAEDLRKNIGDLWNK